MVTPSNYPNPLGKTLGERNNNPLNIREVGTAWNGKVGANKGFVAFKTMSYGVRAGIRTLRTYYEKHKLKTVQGIITRWAPPTENDTKNYVQFVCTQLGVNPTTQLLFTERTIKGLVTAMAKMECGGYKISDDVFAEAWQLEQK